MNQKDLDIVVYGATGFTGRYICQYLAKLAKEKNLKWAIAGRSLEKLRPFAFVLMQNHDIARPTTLIADTQDEKALGEIAKRAKLLINCVGPFRHTGLPVVQACIENKCHYIDITGEPEFMEESSARYHELAQDAGVLVVHACGFDSIPAELGTLFATEVAKRENVDLENIESFLKFTGPTHGPFVNYTTYESAIYGVSSQKSLSKFRRQNRNNRWSGVEIKRSGKSAKLKKAPFYDERTKSWSVLFAGADSSVVRNTQKARVCQGYKDSQPRYFAYMNLPGIKPVTRLAVSASAVGVLSGFGFGRKILLDYPELFTFGGASKVGPRDSLIQERGFKMDFFCEGQGKRYQFRVTGPEPGYVATPIITVHSALTLLEESGKLNIGGGVFTPGAVFHPTTLRDRLSKSGMTFEVIEPKALRHAQPSKVVKGEVVKNNEQIAAERPPRFVKTPPHMIPGTAAKNRPTPSESPNLHN